ncbi:hypothetical protein Tco_0318457 [Tanacetum coccineum]
MILVLKTSHHGPSDAKYNPSQLLRLLSKEVCFISHGDQHASIDFLILRYQSDALIIPWRRGRRPVNNYMGRVGSGAELSIYSDDEILPKTSNKRKERRAGQGKSQHQHLCDIRATDIAEKLVLAKRVDFMSKVNFLKLFSNVMGTADTMKAISVCSLIEEKLKIIFEEKAELEDLLRKSSTQFPNDEDLSVVKTEDVVEYVVNEPQEEKFKEETFTQWIEANIEWAREDDLFVWPWKVQSVNVQCPETPQ